MGTAGGGDLRGITQLLRAADLCGDSSGLWELRTGALPRAGLGDDLSTRSYKPGWVVGGAVRPPGNAPPVPESLCDLRKEPL